MSTIPKAFAFNPEPPGSTLSLAGSQLQPGFRYLFNVAYDFTITQSKMRRFGDCPSILLTTSRSVDKKWGAHFERPDVIF